MARQNTYYKEETKKPVASREARLEGKYSQARKETYVHPTMVGMQKQTAGVPQNSRHMMKF